MTNSFIAADTDARKRLDHYLLKKFPQYSRSRLQSWIRQGLVRINGQEAKASLILHGGEQIEVSPADLPPLQAAPEDLPIQILYEDASVIAINKPAGLVVHAGAGAHSGTLVNRLVHHFQMLSKVGGDLRPGIVHRLDKGTSGVLLVARNDIAHQALAAQFSGRTVEKTYLALVHGDVKGNMGSDAGRISTPITRDPIRRIRMSTTQGKGRTALTDFRVMKRFGKFTHLEVRISTGRTHQIRVHLSSIGHPVAGDRLYGAPKISGSPMLVVSKKDAPTKRDLTKTIEDEDGTREETARIFLHAWRIVFTSPATGERVTVEAPLPQDLAQWLDELAKPGNG